MNKLIPSVDVPEGTSGNWRIERFTISEAEAKHDNFMSSLRGGRRFIYAGNYTRLMRGNTVAMSDTDAEKNDHSEAVRRASGVILVNGLGIGMVLNAALLKPEVERAFVVEKSLDVIALSGPHYQKKFGNRVEIIHDDALTFSPPKGIRFGAVWHDIWDYICSDNLEQMKQLHRRYGRRAEWQGSWCRVECEYANR